MSYLGLSRCNDKRTSTKRKFPLDGNENQDSLDRKAKDSSVSPALLSILTITDWSSLNEEKFQDFFEHVAHKLLNEFVLMVNQKAFRIIEIEFYFWHPMVHSDLFTHRDLQQQNMAEWYFHKTGNSFRGGTFKGLDITFGKTDEYYGGILIRSIESLDIEVGKINIHTMENRLTAPDIQSEVIEGPSVTVDHLLLTCGVSTISELISTKMFGSLAQCSMLMIRHYTELPSSILISSRMVFSSPRVGLSLRRNDHQRKRLDFLCKHYRFCTLPNRLRKSRVHTVLGVLQQNYSKTNQEEERVVDQIYSLTAIRKSIVYQCVRHFLAGRRKSKEFIDSVFTKQLKPRQLCELCGLLSKQDS